MFLLPFFCFLGFIIKLYMHIIGDAPSTPFFFFFPLLHFYSIFIVKVCFCFFLLQHTNLHQRWYAKLITSFLLVFYLRQGTCWKLSTWFALYNLRMDGGNFTKFTGWVYDGVRKKQLNLKVKGHRSQVIKCMI